MPRCFLVPFTAALVALICLPALARAAGPERVGGPCRYESYPGTATFVDVKPWQPESPTAGVPTPYPPLTVTFQFVPNQPITNEPLYRPGAVHTFTLINSMPPGPRFAAKYGIMAGAAVPCQLRVIREGTCTPVVFEFPGIDRADYFELTGKP
ncbi:hypothetical protein [Solidesulfovibrio magneticus]|uniref:Lipoprotein n=1 Tax=Solidesulfovibrio magneticus (strain ATCC 700980 / DSM 13731 / RS-1) TaxID=573370 RepID=C4XSB1_SOLM1|nr:hypothetical protein [Solidesulfovibrio magneticus]BAH75633.1 hypothetical protein DMR_21420 [Solidesulfovibrio magneticus RS-1]